MKSSRLWEKNRMLQHVVFWVLLFLIYALAFGGNESYYYDYLQNTFLKFPFYIIAAYTFNYWQVPRFLNKKKTFVFVISLIFTSFFLFVVFKIFNQILYDSKLGILNIPSYLTKTLMFYMPALMIYAYQTQRRQQKERDRLLMVQQEKLDTELKYLKAQLNPHFLFNTLNNLYSFVVNQSPKAADMVLQLSEILDYVLYKSQAELVSVSEEVKSIENYIALEKIRYGNRLKVLLSKPDHLVDQQIAPLVLLSIVENAFKHGASGGIPEPEISIKLHQNQDTLEFDVWNTCDPAFKGVLNDSYKEGIGLSNIKRQLNLIYQDRHQLKIEESSNHFSLNLIIKTR